MRPPPVDPAPVATYADRPVTKAPNWHGLVTLDILFNNLSAGLFIVAAMAELVVPTTFAPVARVAYPLALVLLLADLVCLVLDLGDPWRFHHMLRVWKPSSPMSLGTWCLTIYSAPLTLLTGMSLFPTVTAGFEWLRAPLLIAGLLPALGVALYKGVLFSTTSQPGWTEARWLGGYLVNSALMLGAAEMLAIAVVQGEAGPIAVLRPALVLLLVLNLAALLLLLADIRPALARAHTGRDLVFMAAQAIGAGLVLPGFLLVLGGAAMILVAVALTLLGASVVRSEIVHLPHLLAESRSPTATGPARHA